MREIAPDVYVLEGVRGCNVYLLGSGEELTLIDTGMPGQAGAILSQLREVGFVPGDLRTIVLTHGHLDHVGSARALAARCGARILAHQDEVPYIEGARPMPATSALSRLMYRATALMFRLAAPRVDAALLDAQMVHALGGLQVCYNPGHTPGSISLYQPERGLLFCGDALFNRNPLTGRRGLQLPLASVSADMAQARASARLLADLAIEMLLPGHGEPVSGDVPDRILALLGEPDDRGA